MARVIFLMPFLKFGYCPVCQREFDFVIGDNIINAYKKTKNGVITYRTEFRKNMFNPIEVHYYIFQEKVGIIIRELKTNHFNGMVLDPEENWHQVKYFAFNEKRIIEYFSDILEVEVKTEDITALMDSLIWDKFFEKLQYSLSMTLDASWLEK